MREKKNKDGKEKVTNVDADKKVNKLKKCNIGEALDKVLDKVNNYFFVPFLLILGLTWLGQYYKGSTFGLVVNIMLTAVFFVWIGIIIYKLCRRLTKIAIIWPLIISLVALITSLITSFSSEVLASNFSFIVGIILMEVFLIYLIVYDAYDTKNRLSRVIISSILFVVLGYITIFYSSYGLEDKTIFNALISVFSAIVGGGLTLGGVAWTIKHEKEENRKVEIQRVKPAFTFDLVRNLPQSLEGVKVCFPEAPENEYLCNVYAIIENSNQSAINLRRVYHDGKWFNLELNNLVIPGGKFYFNFRFNEPQNIILEVSDILGNLYYYKIEVILTALIGGVGDYIHTIRGIIEVSKDEVDNIIKNNEKKQQN